MERVLKKKSEAGHYKADACIVWCFDDRFSPLLESFMREKQFSHIDLIKIAGGAKDLASPADASAREYLLDQIAKSIKLHHAPLVILMAHSECGAYDGSMDENFYIAELKKAANVVKEKFPEISIESYFADFEGMSLV